MRIVLTVTLAITCSLTACADEATVLRLNDVLVLQHTGVGGRIPVPHDRVQTALALGRWRTPQAGDEIAAGIRWQAAKADEQGVLSDNQLARGYVLWTVQVEQDCVMQLDAQGHGLVYVNGRPRYGDLYGYRFALTPIPLKEGSNELHFHCRGNQLQAQLLPVAQSVELQPADSTLPDLLLDQLGMYHAATVVLNNTSDELTGVALRATVGDESPVITQLPSLPAHSITKVPFQIEHAGGKPEKYALKLELLDHDDRDPVDVETMDIRVVDPSHPHRRTFVSEVDGSIQYYAVKPALPIKASDPPPAIVFSTHGASVEATGQAAAYGAKTWAHIVAGTNRRPFGFDWEDWGRLDALEALAAAKTQLPHDPQRIYLTGHSMGGHGAWHLGTIYPDQFAAVGPSAGWMSFWTYGSRNFDEPQSEVGRILLRTTTPSRPRQLSRNLLSHAVYILHGAADETVPVQQARQMREHLAAFHTDLHYHEEPAAGHWWDDNQVSGALCVDWPPMFDVFSRRRIPLGSELRHIHFTTANPAISAECHWLSIIAQIIQLAPSAADLDYDPLKSRISGSTTNVSCLSLDLGDLQPSEEWTIELDGQKLTHRPSAEGRIVWLQRREGLWTLEQRPAPNLKGPHRSGPFKEVFGNRFILVYGTHGTEEENEWARTKAAFDAETFWYRGNASVAVISDDQLLSDLQVDRNVVLYGNANTNAAWSRVIDVASVELAEGRARLGEQEFVGEDIACLMIRPRAGSDTASVGVVGGTGLVGMRLTDRLPYFTSGVAYPDVTLMDQSAMTLGVDGILAAGFFGRDWGVASGEFAIRQAVDPANIEPTKTDPHDVITQPGRP